ncbi:MAG: lamin tail domain-containing protein [Bacteroidales bacterium]|nr:lamin tail domain-containing protein [Bacteroidales bacterium]
MKIQKIVLILMVGIFVFSSCKKDKEDDQGTTDETYYTGLVLNEICGAQTPDDDWIEIYNNSSERMDLSGVKLTITDSKGSTQEMYTFPENAAINAGSYQVIATLSGELKASISNTDQIVISLVSPKNNVIDRFNRDTQIGKNTSHVLGGSYARVPNAIGKWSVIRKATRGTINVEEGAEVIDYSVIVLNEICGKQDPDDDWIEIFNKSDKEINIGGIGIIKTDETGESKSIFTIPVNTKLAAGAYMVIATLSGELTSGISNTKQVGIAINDPEGNVIDSFDRDEDIGLNKSHPSGGSFARIPDGTGSWVIIREATRGIANKEEEELPDVDYSGIVINEICGLQNPDDDWVEIFNSSGNEIDLGYVQIIKTDDVGEIKSIYTFPANTMLAAGAYKVIATLTGELTSGISNSKQVGIALQAPNGDMIDSFDRNNDVGNGKEHLSGGSYGRIPNGSATWAVLIACTRGTENIPDPVYTDDPDTDYSLLVLNELNGNGDKYIELYNKGNVPLDISNVFIRKNAEDMIIYRAPEGTTVPAGGFLTLPSDQVDYSTGFLGGLSAKKSLLIELYTPSGNTLIDVFKNLKSDGTEVWDGTPKYNGENNVQSFGRYPDGTGPWFMMTATQNTANTQGTTAIEW